jgi:hypothetical protein
MRWKRKPLCRDARGSPASFRLAIWEVAHTRAQGDRARNGDARLWDGVQPSLMILEGSCHCWGGGNEIAAKIAVRLLAPCASGDVVGACRFPERCPGAG